MSDPEDSIVVLDKESESSFIEKIVKRLKEAGDENRADEDRARQVAKEEDEARQEKIQHQEAEDLHQTTTDAIEEVSANPIQGFSLLYRAVYGRKKEVD